MDLHEEARMKRYAEERMRQQVAELNKNIETVQSMIFRCFGFHHPWTDAPDFMRDYVAYVEKEDIGEISRWVNTVDDRAGTMAAILAFVSIDLLDRFSFDNVRRYRTVDRREKKDFSSRYSGCDLIFKVPDHFLHKFLKPGQEYKGSLSRCPLSESWGLNGIHEAPLHYPTALEIPLNGVIVVQDDSYWDLSFQVPIEWFCAEYSYGEDASVWRENFPASWSWVFKKDYKRNKTNAQDDPLIKNAKMAEAASYAKMVSRVGGNR